MSLAAYIDHTLLKPDTTAQDVAVLCDEAVRHGFAAVCVPPAFVKQATQRTAGSAVKTATVIGFPFGYSCIEAKLAEIKTAIAHGADELDMVINLGALREGNMEYLSGEIAACLQPVRLHRKLIKVIIESGILIDKEIIACCALYARHKVDFLKTSTGYAAAGADVAAVKLMREHLPPEIAIKASGGIRTFAYAQELVEAGATRIGTSSGVSISTP